MRGMRELKVEMDVLMKNTRSYTSWPLEEPKGFVMRYLWFDDPNHKQGGCGLYVDAIKSGIIIFKG